MRSTRFLLINVAKVAVAISLGRGFLFAQPRPAAKPQVQITRVSVTPTVIHLNQGQGPTCAMATVEVGIEGAGTEPRPSPQVSVSLIEYSSAPPGVTVRTRNVDPSTGKATLTGSTQAFKFEVCATGTNVGRVVLQGGINDVEPKSIYDVEGPNPVSGRTEITVQR